MSVSRTFRRTGRLTLGCGLLVFVACGCGQLSDSSAQAAPDTNAPQTRNDVPVKQETPTLQVIEPSELPKPFATASANNPSKVVPRPESAALTVPPGFHIHEWADGLENPRIVTVAPNGDVFVAESQPNRVKVLRGADGDGKAEKVSIFTSGLRQPFGIAFYPPGPNPTHVYIANTDSVVRFPYKNGDTEATGGPETIVAGIPGGGYNQHWTRNIAFRPDGKKMFVSVGSRTNASEEEPIRAAISEYNPDGSGHRIYASGIRNPVGLAFNPIDNRLWTACNERDEIGDDLVPDYATAVKEGGFYGWPWYYMGKNHDPRLPERPELKAKTLVPDVLFQSHVAALGIEFYTGKQFPAAYKNSAFVALHGSWNRAQRSGYSIVRLPIGANGRAEGGFEEFVKGWAMPDGRVWGRPVDVAVAKDGSLLITDDGAGKIWQVTYIGTRKAAR